VFKYKGIIVGLTYILGTAGISIEPAGSAFYEQHDVMRNWCAQVQQWTGLEMPALLNEDFTASLMPGGPGAPREPADLSVRPEFLYRGEVRQAALTLGIADVLAEQGIYPDLLVGTSLGGMIAACLAGSWERETLFKLLGSMTAFPLAPAGEPARGMAFGVVPADADIDWYCGDGRPNVYLTGDASMDGNRVVMFSGYLKDLEDLAAEAPPGQIHTVIGAMGGLHSPLQQFARDLLEPLVNEIDFRDPQIRLLSALGGAELKTGKEVRADIIDNVVNSSSSVADLVAAIEKYDTAIALTVGASLPLGPPPSPFPVLQAVVPRDLGQIMTMVYDLGIEVK